MPASRFDDIKNGVDVVTIFETEDATQYIGLGIDVTYSSDDKVLEKKLHSIKERIRNMSLPFVKYFEDPNTGEHKNFFVPKVLVGSRLSSAEKLVKLWGRRQREEQEIG